MPELGLAEYFNMRGAIGIIATLFVILYFSRKQMRSLSVDTQTRALNDLHEKFHRMTEISVADPSVHKIIDAHKYLEEDRLTASSITAALSNGSSFSAEQSFARDSVGIFSFVFSISFVGKPIT
jgi:hypothetical protein